MSNGVKLGCFFAVSVVLHGAGLWALAGTLEPRSAVSAAEVSIIDRDLFFRQAARAELRASRSVSAVERLDPASGHALQPIGAEASVLPQRAEAAALVEPERRTPEAVDTTSLARLDLSTMEPATPVIQDMVPLGSVRPDQTEPVRLSGVPAAREIAAVRPRVQRSATAAQVSRIRAYESLASAGPISDAAPAIPPQLQPDEVVAEVERARAASPANAPQRIHRPMEAGEQLAPATAVETLAGAEARRAPRRTVEDIVRLEASPLPVLAAMPAPVLEIEGGPAEPAETLDPTLTLPSEPPAVLEPLDEPNRIAAAPGHAVAPLAPMAPVSEASPWRAPREPERLAGNDARPKLRGTLAPEVLGPREPRVLASAESLAAVPSADGGLRIPAADAVEPARVRPSIPIVPRRAVPRVDPRAARAPRTAGAAPPAARGPAPDPVAAPVPVDVVAPREVVAVTPASPAPPVEASEPAGPEVSDLADRFTWAYRGGECFFPLRVASRDQYVIRGYGLRPEAVRLFREAFAEAIGTEPQVNWRPLTDAQCTGISFTRLILGESAPGVHIDLARKELENDEELAGRVTGNRFDFVTLLVVDDSGRVHNVLEYLQPEDSELEFSVPVHPVDDGVDRVQLIIAIAASRPLPALKSTTVKHSDDFFPELLDQARELGASLDLGLEDFVILDDPGLRSTR